MSTTTYKDGRNRLAGPILSIVIPVLNRQKKLNNAIAELQDQVAHAPDGWMEVIIVDDNSMPPILPNWPKNAGITLLRNACRIGANASRFKGLTASQGIYINFHDSDDGFADGWLEGIFEVVLNKRISPDVIVTRRWDESNISRKARAQHWYEKNHSNPDLVRRMLSIRNCLGPFGGVLFSRDILQDVHFANAASSQDWLVYLQVFDKSPITAIAPKARFVYRLDGSDRISADPKAKVLGLFSLIRATRNDSPFHQGLRFYQLHRFSFWIRQYGRHSLLAAWRRSLALQLAWSLAITAYAIVFLHLRSF